LVDCISVLLRFLRGRGMRLRHSGARRRRKPGIATCDHLWIPDRRWRTPPERLVQFL